MQISIEQSPDQISMISSVYFLQVSLCQASGVAHSETNLEQARDEWISIIDSTAQEKAETSTIASSQIQEDRDTACRLQKNMMIRLQKRKRLGNLDNSENEDSENDKEQSHFQENSVQESESSAERIFGQT